MIINSRSKALRRNSDVHTRAGVCVLVLYLLYIGMSRKRSIMRVVFVEFHNFKNHCQLRCGGYVFTWLHQENVAFCCSTFQSWRSINEDLTCIILCAVYYVYWCSRSNYMNIIYSLCWYRRVCVCFVPMSTWIILLT